MRVFGNPSVRRGCFMLVHVDANASRGAVLRLPAGGNKPSTWGDAFLVTSVNFQAGETVLHSANFSDSVFTYAMGNDPNAGKASVNFMVLLGDNGAAPLLQLIELYRNNRVSVALRKAQVYIAGGDIISGYVSGVQSSTADTGINAQTFTFQLDVTRL